MTNFIKRLVFFLIFSIIGYLVLIIVWGELGPTKLQKNLTYKINAYGHLNSRLKEVKEFNNVDVLFLGSSRSYRHYDPRIFAKMGYSSFNLGSSSQTFLQTEVLLNRYLRDLNPKLIVLDIYPGMFNSDGVESSLDLISNDKVDIPTFKMVLSQKNIKVFNTFIYSWYKSSINMEDREVEGVIKGGDKYVSGGYVNKTVSRSIKRESDTVDFIIRDYQIDAFVNIIHLIREEGKKVIIVQSPRHKGKIFYKENRLDSIMESNNLEYLNYSNLSILDDVEHFYNPMHLNQDGVEIYNNMLISEVLD